MKSEEPGKAVREVWSQWFEISSWHGVPDFYRGETLVAKMFWGSILIATAVQVTQQAKGFIDGFTKGPKWTTLVHYIQSTDGMTMPNLTFCSMGPASKSELKRWDIPEEAFNYMWDGLKRMDLDAPSPSEASNLLRKREWGALEGRLEAKIMLNTTDLLKRASFSCEQSMVLCFWEGSIFDCCQHTTIIPARDRFCLRLSLPRRDGDRPAAQFKPGEQSAFSIILESNGSDYYPPHYSWDLGYQVYPSFGDTQYVESVEPIALSPGTRIWVSMMSELRTIRFANPFYSFIYDPPPPCSFNVSLELLTGAYTESGCAADCTIRPVIQICNCSSVANLKPHIPVCDPIQAHECAEKLQQHKSELKERANNCTRLRCSPSCHGKSVRFSSSVNTFPNPATIQQFQEKIQNWANRSLSRARAGQLTMLTLYYESSFHMALEQQERVSVDTLISNIGGVMGVWGGISLITIVQICAYIWTMAHKLFSSAFIGIHRKVHGTQENFSPKTKKPKIHQEEIKTVKANKCGSFRNHESVQSDSKRNSPTT